MDRSPEEIIDTINRLLEDVDREETASSGDLNHESRRHLENIREGAENEQD